MKDITIKGADLRRECFILLGCFIAAVCINIFAILKYDRPASELFTMLGYVVAVSVVLYGLSWLIRLIIMFPAWLCRKCFRK